MSAVSVVPVARPTLASRWQAFEAWVAQRNEPDFIAERRRKAFDLYQQRLEIPLDPEEYKPSPMFVMRLMMLRTNRQPNASPFLCGCIKAGNAWHGHSQRSQRLLLPRW